MTATVPIILGVLLLALAILVFWRERLLRARFRVMRERAERLRSDALRERDQLLDALGDAYLLVDDASRIVFANKAARRMLKGRSLKGKSIAEAFIDAGLSTAIMNCVRTGKPMKERVVLSQSGSRFLSAKGQPATAWVIDAAPLLEEGSEAMTRIVLRDITAEQRTEEMRRDFVANASHELRTPIAIINGYLENLMDNDLLDDSVTSRRFLGIMRKHGERVSRLVEDMLALSRMESGEAPALRREEFSLKDCVRDVLERLEPMVSGQKAGISVTIDPENMGIRGDRFYWLQIFHNLIENALKQNTAPGLRIGISARRKKSGATEIRVRDNGKGVPAADIPCIFLRFYRVEKSHSQNETKGTGLGLSIVKRAVEAHGGTVTVTSVPGQETCFTIVVPVKQSTDQLIPQGVNSSPCASATGLQVSFPW